MTHSPNDHNGVLAPIFGAQALSPSNGVAVDDTSPSQRLAVSVVLPMYNEEGAAAELVQEVAEALRGLAFEVIAVDDASTDTTVARLQASGVEALRILQHGVNAGQSRAVRTGVLAARAPVIVTLDGDGQNDPKDIQTLVEALTADDAPPLLAMVAGERRGRQDTASKKAASRIANRIRARLLKDGASDTGCGLKAFRRDAYLRLPYFDHAHRYLPALMRREGYEVAFAPVAHRARVHGVSKYTNLGRLAVAFRDMMGVMWLNDRARAPERIFELRGPGVCDKTSSTLAGDD